MISNRNILSKILLGCFLVIAIQSCEQPIDLSIENNGGSIVIYSVLEPDSVPKVFVMESEPYYTYTNNTEVSNQLIENATVTLSDGQQSWELIPDSIAYLPIFEDSWYWGPEATIGPNGLTWGPNGPEARYKAFAFTNKDAILKAENTYIINVEKDKKTATAETLIFERPSNITYAYKEEIIDYYGYEFNNNSIEYSFVNKRPGDYYRLVIRNTKKLHICDFDQNPAELIDSVASYHYDYFKMENSDVQNEVINGTINLSTIDCDFISSCSNIEPSDTKEIQIALQVIDGNLIRYIDLLEFQQEIEGNPFIEPAPADNNVEGGIGIFTAISNSQWYSISIPCE